jgi:hypothetical protein
MHETCMEAAFWWNRSQIFVLVSNSDDFHQRNLACFTWGGGTGFIVVCGSI